MEQREHDYERIFYMLFRVFVEEEATRLSWQEVFGEPELGKALGACYELQDYIAHQLKEDD